MDNKRWSFKVPGGQEGSEKTIDMSQITSVYELLATIRGEEDVQQPGTERRPQTAPLPFSRRLGSKGRRRHPSA
ncbi:hypothetical protein R70723_04075 [Paenibacillus sp. FSL R7-0273]|uniref:hypothetical protein n=1 Tax=Paenibacillus sp. FSL R7-0273 TaxID=1536772 RepID=UPI0004F87BD3|nr:hypothetical protein [Paenibacillus sp. FSL R7-0273]AIQ45163.1 hypothetical protein R70723_04075 [Paenibacillus sp. FSL R7-0273]OMF86594.1 hypothetical protein BK144_25620 [Paenibacillus sp. FSL R7-0273]